MTTIVTRTTVGSNTGKGSPLTHTEVDTNFVNLNTAKLETAAIPLGTLQAPSVSFLNDSDTGIFCPQGGNSLAIATGGQYAITCSSTQAVGIKTANPNAALHVAGNARVGADDATDAVLEIGAGASGNRTSYIDIVADTTYTDYGLRVIRNNTGANATSELKHRGTGALNFTTQEAAPIVFNTTNSPALTILAGGNVGIGTSLPDASLHIDTTLNRIIRASSSDTGVTNSLLINNGNNFHYGVLGNVSGTTLVGGDVYGLGYTASAGADFTPVLSWTANTGRVGIGTTTVDARLLVSDGTNINTRIGQLSLDNFTGEGAGIRFSRTTSDDSLCALGTLNAGAGDLGLFSRNSLIFATGGASNYSATTERACIDSSGRLLVGTTTTTSAGELLRVKKDSTGTNGAGINFEGSYSLDDDASQTVSIASSSLITITNENELQGALLFATYASATITIISDPSNIIATSDTDTKLCLFKSANTSNVTVKNRLGANKGILIGRITT